MCLKNENDENSVEINILHALNDGKEISVKNEKLPFEKVLRVPLRVKNHEEKEPLFKKLALRQKRRQTLFEFGKENRKKNNLNPFLRKENEIENVGQKKTIQTTNFLTEIPNIYQNYLKTQENLKNSTIFSQIQSQVHIQFPPQISSKPLPLIPSEVSLYANCAEEVLRRIPQGAKLNLSEIHGFNEEKNPEKEYQRDIYDYMKEIEVKCRAGYGMMFKDINKSNLITKQIRNNVVRILIKKCYKQDLSNLTLELAVNIFDRVLEKGLIRQSTINKYLTACLFIAMKYEETDYIDIDSCLNMFSFNKKKAIFDVEREILDSLNFDVTIAYASQFIDRLAFLDGNYKKDVHFGALFYLDLCLGNIDTLITRPSLLSASLYHYSKSLLSGPENLWPKNLQFETGYNEKDIKKVQSKVGKVLRESCNSKLFEVVLEKYKTEKYRNVGEKLTEKIGKINMENKENNKYGRNDRNIRKFSKRRSTFN